MSNNNSLWPEVRLGELLTYIDPLIELDDEAEYTTITVKRRHGGLEARENLFGSQIQTKKQYKLVPGAFIISRVQCWHQAYAIVPDAINPNMIASINYDQFVIPSEIDKRFFWWLSYSPRFTEIVRSCAFGVVIEKMVFNRNAWLEKTIPFPPFEEQRRIVARIEELAAKIEEARGLHYEAMREAKTSISSYLEEEFAEIAVNGSLGEVLYEKPRNGWSAKCDNIETGVPVLSLGAVTGFTYRATEFKRTSEPISESAHYWLHTGDLLMTRSNAPNLVGHVAIYDGSPSPCIYPDLMMRLNVNENIVSKRFIQLWLRSTRARDYIRRVAKGTSSSMVKISQETVMNIPFPSHLSLQRQNQIVAFANGLEKTVNDLKNFQAEILAELDALLPSILDKAFKGEL